MLNSPELGLILFFFIVAIASSLYNYPKFLTPRRYQKMSKRERLKYKKIECSNCRDKVFYGDYAYVNKDNYSIFNCNYSHC